MQYVLGLLSGVALLALLYGAYALGRRSRRPTPTQRDVDEQTRQKAARLRAGFEQMMSYDVTTALSGKKGT